uniref:Protein kinase domain-containing protein n=1 Tax=Meloidogyne floridensis TaxID=298350 RepID=A0A915PCB8_9BILA
MIYLPGSFAGCFNSKLAGKDDKDQEIGMTQHGKGGGSKRHDVKKHGKDVASTSHGAVNTCHCKQNNINYDSFVNLTTPENENIELNTIVEMGKGGFGEVSHAYWPTNNSCVALKVSTVDLQMDEGYRNFRKFLIKNEVEVLNYFSNEVDEKESTFIIKIYRNVEIVENNQWKMYTLMELGGQTLIDYVYQKFQTEGITPQQVNAVQKLLIDVIKGAGRALNQFHRHAVHLDVKVNNFVVSPNQDQDIIAFKLIDFNASVLLEGEDSKSFPAYGTLIFKAPEIREDDIHTDVTVTRKADVWAFGLMIYGLFYNKNQNFTSMDKKENRYVRLDKELEKYRNNVDANNKLDRVIKGCIQINPVMRPSMLEILKFLNNKLEAFEYERGVGREDLGME